MSLHRVGGVLLAAVVTASLGAACGGGSGPEELVLRAQGTATSATVSYRTPAGEATETVTLPWEMAIEVEGEWSVSLAVTNETLDGKVTCAIGGLRLPVGATGEAGATCRASGDGSEVSTSARGEGFVRVDGAPAAVSALRLPVGRPALRAFATVGDVAWSAAASALLGSNVATGEQTRSEVAIGVNAIAADGQGAIFAAANAGLGDDPEDLVRVADGLEEVFFSIPNLGEQVAASEKLVWVTAREPDVLFVLDASTGDEKNRIPGDFELLAAHGNVALLWDGANLRVLDSQGNELAAEPAANRPAAAVLGDGFLLVTFLDRNTPALRLVDERLEPIREGAGAIPFLPSSISVTEDGVIFVGLDGAAVGVDAETLAPLCALETTFKFLGAGATYLYFHDTSEGDLVAYARADAGC